MTTTQQIVKSAIEGLSKKHNGDLVLMLKEVKQRIDELEHAVRCSVEKEANVAFSAQRGLDLAKSVFSAIQSKHKKKWLANRK